VGKVVAYGVRQRPTNEQVQELIVKSQVQELVVHLQETAVLPHDQPGN
jgi:hypothetical protein